MSYNNYKSIAAVRRCIKCNESLEAQVINNNWSYKPCYYVTNASFFYGPLCNNCYLNEIAAEDPKDFDI